jgi:hypothetical protein
MAADAPQEGAFISKSCFNNQLQLKTVSDAFVIKKKEAPETSQNKKW